MDQEVTSTEEVITLSDYMAERLGPAQHEATRFSQRSRAAEHCTDAAGRCYRTHPSISRLVFLLPFLPPTRPRLVPSA